MTRDDEIRGIAVAAITAMLTDDTTATLTTIAMLDDLDRGEVECLVFALAHTAATGVIAVATETDQDPLDPWRSLVARQANSR